MPWDQSVPREGVLVKLDIIPAGWHCWRVMTIQEMARMGGKARQAAMTAEERIALARKAGEAARGKSGRKPKVVVKQTV